MPGVSDRVVVRRQALGASIRKHRLEAQKTQAVLAVEADTARSYLSDVERGVVGCSLDWLYEIAAVLGVPMTALIPADPVTSPTSSLVVPPGPDEGEMDGQETGP
jgi:transcriptional regulator with XRE-family HTH domain